MKCSLMGRKAVLLGASLLSLALPPNASAGSVTVVSDTSWNVFDANAQWLGLAQTVCLNTTNPASCPLGATPAPTVYGYPFDGWTANLSSLPTGARWIWAPNITGASSPAALQTFTFETDFYLCDPPVGGSISVAVDNSAEVSLNGTLVPNSMSTSQSALETFTIPASSLLGSSLILGARPNRLKVTASNAANPADCGSDQYKCNPAGVVLGATFEFAGNPTCAGFKGGTYSNGQSETLSSCPAGYTGSMYHICLCGNWTPNMGGCVPPPPTCTGNDGKTYGVDEREPVACPPATPNGSASRKCVAKDTWGSPDYSQCAPPPTTCRGNGGTLFTVNQKEDLGPCPAPQIGSKSRTCESDGSWGDLVDTCDLPQVCVGEPPGTCICGSHEGQTGICPPGVECGSRRLGDPAHPERVTSDWYCGSLPPKPLGESCPYNGSCVSGYCDRGDGTSKTGLCMPMFGAGNISDWCSNNNQCASGRCGGLRQDLSGAWQPGHCSSNTKSALGEFCSFNSDCTSTYCDRGDGTSKTSMCMPRGGAGGTGDWCSHDSQCSSHMCGGLQPRADGSWQPGHCN